MGSGLRERLIKTGARLVRHSRFAVFQMTEAALPRTRGEPALAAVSCQRPAEIGPFRASLGHVGTHHAEFRTGLGSPFYCRFRGPASKQRDKGGNQMPRLVARTSVLLCLARADMRSDQ